MTSLTSSRPLRADLTLFTIATVLLTGVPYLIILLTGWEVLSGPGLWLFGLGTSGPSLAALAVFLVWSRRRRRVARTRVAATWLWAPAAVVLGILPTVAANLLVDPGAFSADLARAPEVLAGFGGGLLFVVLFLIGADRGGVRMAGLRAASTAVALDPRAHGGRARLGLGAVARPALLPPRDRSIRDRVVHGRRTDLHDHLHPALPPLRVRHREAGAERCGRPS